MSQFAELLAQLAAQQEEQETLAKALPAEGGEDDEAIQAAAAEGDDAGNENDDDDGDDETPAQPLTKSMTAIVDGEEVEAVDATDLLKSLDGRLGDVETTLAKGLQVAMGTIKAQGDLIKSLNDQINKLAGQGKGRKSVITVSEKPAAGESTLAKSEPQGMTNQEFLLKANAAFAAGKLSGQELTTADVAIRMGQQVPAQIIAKALS